MAALDATAQESILREQCASVSRFSLHVLIGLL